MHYSIGIGAVVIFFALLELWLQYDAAQSGQAHDQHLVHQRRSVGAEFAFDPTQPQHRLALAFSDRLPLLHTIDIFARGIDGLRAALGLFPIVLERTTALVLRLVDLAM